MHATTSGIPCLLRDREATAAAIPEYATTERERSALSLLRISHRENVPARASVLDFESGNVLSDHDYLVR